MSSPTKPAVTKAPQVVQLGAPAIGIEARAQAAMALRAPTGMLPAVQQELREHVAQVMKAGLMPAHIKTPEQAMVVLLKGRELGFTPMQSLSVIYVVHGLPSLKTEAVLGLAISRCPGLTLEVLKTTATEAEVRLTRGGSSMINSFTIEDAKRAGLLGNPSYQRYPKDMLRWRAIAGALRLMAPDVLQGSYMVEELGDVDLVATAAAAAPIDSSVPADPKGAQGPITQAPIEGAFVKEPEPVAPPATAEASPPRDVAKRRRATKAEPEAPAAAPAVIDQAPAAPAAAPPAAPTTNQQRLADARTAWEKAVDAVKAAGIHPAAKSLEQAATRFAVEVLGAPVAPAIRSLMAGTLSDEGYQALLRNLATVERAALDRIPAREPGSDDLPFNG